MVRNIGIFFAASAVLVFIVVQGCGAAAPGAAIGYSSTVSYGGSGSAYSATMNPDLTFTITRKASTTATTVDLTVTGTFTRLASGILELTVGGSTGAEGPTVGDKAYALDVPGYVMMLKPMSDSGGEIIPMVATGSCPTADFAGTWVMMQDSNTSGNYSTQGLVGSFNYTSATNTGSVGATKYVADGTSSVGSTQSLGALTCTGGVGTFPASGGGTPEMYFTNGGGVIVRVEGGGQSQGIAAVPAAPLTLSSFAGTYVGLAFDEGDSSGATAGTTQPVSVTLDAAGVGTGAVISDVVNNTLSTTMSATIAVSQLSPAVNGALKMVLTPTAGSPQTTVCAAASSLGGTSQNTIFCAGESPSDGSNAKLRSYLLVTKR